MAENEALIKNRFSATNPPFPHTQKHPNGYLTCKFKKWIKKNIYPYHNPVTGLTELIKGVDGIALATIWAALQGDMRATEILLERLEGKSVQKIEGLGEKTKIIIIRDGNKTEQEKAEPARILSFEPRSISSQVKRAVVEETQVNAEAE